MNNKQKKIIVFLFMLLLVAIQIHYVWIYYDDYGYASLSYVYGYTGKTGLNVGINDIFSFLIYHYNHWGGRVLWFFLEIFLLQINIHAFKIVECLFITGIYYYIYRIVEKNTKNNSWIIALASLLCFLLIDLMVIRDSFYWFTASVLYLFPILPVLALIYLLTNDKKTTINTIICIILAFISAWSQEQIGVFIVSFIALWIIQNYITTRKLDKKEIIVLISSIIGFAILMLSPGTRHRIGGDADFYSLSLFNKILKNLPIIIENNFGTNTRLFSLLFFSSTLYLLIRNYKKFKRKWLISIGIINSTLILLVTIIKDHGYFSTIFSISNLQTLFLLIAVIQIGYMIFLLCICFYKNKKNMFSVLLLSGCASQLIMIMAPYFPMRSATIFEITSYIIIVYVYTLILKDKKEYTKFLIIPLIIIGAYNYLYITKGYRNNYLIKVANEQKILAAKKKIKQGKKIKKITLKNTNQVLYGVYEPPEEGLYSMMREYYSLPNEIIIEYK